MHDSEHIVCFDGGHALTHTNWLGDPTLTSEVGSPQMTQRVISGSAHRVGPLCSSDLCLSGSQRARPQRNSHLAHRDWGATWWQE